ncbi:hypothetical protein [Marinobacterium aestuariivivens]|uniref:DUF4175 domain-containing protein n=1 Tax=Marinobacterium aestuariivivens TaxID=1698799 RepID=A0ABW2A8K6_9GAMM
MKAPSVVLTLALSLAAPLALAQQDQEHQAHHPDAAVSGDATAMPSPMEQRLDRMQSIVDRLAETADPAQRRQLMEEHRQAMQETRSMMGAAPGGMGMMGGGMGMMGANQGGMGMMGGQSGMMPMMQRMQDMQAGMDEIINTEDPAKRMELMKEHRRQMQEAMGMMRGMQQGGGMGMMGGGMGMMGKGAMPMMGQQGQAAMLEAFRQMDKRLDLMQQMLEQLMEKQD